MLSDQQFHERQALRAHLFSIPQNDGGIDNYTIYGTIGPFYYCEGHFPDAASAAEKVVEISRGVGALPGTPEVRLGVYPSEKELQIPLSPTGEVKELNVLVEHTRARQNWESQNG